MKKIIIVLLVIVLIVSGSIFFIHTSNKLAKINEEKEEARKQQEIIKNAKIEVTLKDNLVASFYSKVKVSDYIESINGTIVDDYFIDTEKIGDNKIEFEFVNDENIKVPFSYNLQVKDDTPPQIWMGNDYYINEGDGGDIASRITCVDNYDDDPKCEIIGTYNPYEADDYSLTYRATDNSGNVNNHPFTLHVIIPSSGSGGKSSYSNKKTPFEDVQDWYKNENTMIGIDVSEWQYDIDYEALKNAGVEFAIIRVGGTKGIDGNYFLDAKFERNINGFKEVGIPVGIYFYSYAKTKEAAIKDANWVIEQLQNYKIDLPVAYDWENWSFYNEFHQSFYTLSTNAKAFLDTLKDAGYEGLLYGSKNYLEKAWFDIGYPEWLAHYNETTNYAGNYTYWQICSNGKVDGIKGNVDIDIMFLQKED